VKFKRTVVVAIKGIAHGGEDHQLSGGTTGTRAVLTSDPDPYCVLADKSTLLAGYMLECTFRGFTGTAQDYLAAHAKDLSTDRRKSGPSSFLVFEHEDELQVSIPDPHSELDDYIVCFDLAPKPALRVRSDPLLTAVVTALALESRLLYSAKKVTDVVVFHRDDGKPIFSYSGEAGGALAWVSSPLSPETRSRIAATYAVLARASSLQTLARLINASYEHEQDRLRAFLSVWTATEVFISKAFSRYETRLFAAPASTVLLKEYQAVIEKVRDLMQEEYKLLDRFTVIASNLCPTDADADTGLLRAANKLRNTIHKDTPREAELPVDSTRNLLLKYLVLYLRESESDS
jgi:hypothetical protein